MNTFRSFKPAAICVVFLLTAVQGTHLHQRKLTSSSLTVTIQGVPGAGFTTWTFGGSAVASKNGKFNGDGWNCCGSTQWSELGTNWANPYPGGSPEWSSDISFESSNAIGLNIAGTSYRITTFAYGTGVNQTEGNGALSFATNLQCPPQHTTSACISIAQGAQVTWSGSSRAPIDVTMFNEQEVFSNTLAGLPLEVYIEQTNSPAPTQSPVEMPTTSPTSAPTFDALTVTVEGVPGEGFSTWIFEGSTTASKNGKFNGDGWNCCGNTQWSELGTNWANPYYSGTPEWSFDIAFENSNSVEMDIAGTSYHITTFAYGTGVNQTEGNGALSFATNFECPPQDTTSACISIAQGAQVSWSGSSPAPIDVTMFNEHEVRSSTLAGLLLEVFTEQTRSPAPTQSSVERPTTSPTLAPTRTPTSSPIAAPTQTPTSLNVLQVEISGVPQTGTTTWTFSGTSTATKTGNFNGDNWNCCGSHSWNNVGENWADSYCCGYEWSGDIPFGDPTSVEIEIAGVPYSISTFAYGTGENGQDGNGSLSFATSFSCPPTSTNSGCIHMSNGTQVVWSGQSTASVDVTKFNTNTFSNTLAGLDLNVVVIQL